MADKKIRDCLERVGDAERALTQLRVVEQQLVATREILELLQLDPAMCPASSGFVLGQNVVDIDMDTKEALDANEVTLCDTESPTAATSSMITMQGRSVSQLKHAVTQASVEAAKTTEQRGGDLEVSEDQLA